jgi:hypothetical protein
MAEKVASSSRLKLRLVRGFSILLFELLIVFGGFSFIIHQEKIDGVPKPLRAVFEFNEKLWMALFNPAKVDKISTPAPKNGKDSRVNGSYGLDSNDISNWKMIVATPLGPRTPHEMSFTLEDLKRLPRTEYVNQFKCIEGWSEVISFSGVKFIDFLNHYHLGTHSGNPIDLKHPEDLFSNVGLETPDGEYYVSVDMKSMLGDQTLLAYEMNGEPLTLEHGAPLRLAIPTKYGVKNLKRIGRIQFADNKLPDYWGEEGYDWFIGL